LITVEPKTKKVRIAPELETTKYKEEVDGKELKLPELPKDEELCREELLKRHYKQCKWISD
jgi:hypothetical protein